MFAAQFLGLLLVGWLPAYIPWSRRFHGGEKVLAFFASVLLIIAVVYVPVLGLLGAGGDQSGDSMAFGVFVMLPALALLAAGIISAVVKLLFG